MWYDVPIIVSIIINKYLSCKMMTETMKKIFNCFLDTNTNEMKIK